MAASLGQNMINNGDFEQSSQYWQLQTPLSWSANNGADGSGSILMNAEAALRDGYIYAKTASQCIQIENARNFSLNASFRYDSLPIERYGHEIHVVWYDGDNCTKGGQQGTFLRPKIKNGWQNLYSKNLTASLNAKSVKIVLAQNQHSSAKEMGYLKSFLVWVLSWFNIASPFPLAHGYWDNISLIPTKLSQAIPDNPSVNSKYVLPAGENYLKNSAFDKDNQHWRAYSESQWTAEDGYHNRGALLGTIVSPSGSRGTGVAYQCTNFGLPQIFEMGVRFKQSETSTQTGGGRFRVTWYEKENCQGQSTTDRKHIDPKPMSGWQNLVVKNLKSPSGATSARVSIIQSIKGEGEFSAYWDDAYFKAVTNY
ncbi:hypothetical protein DC094_01670 [Pelagibaculum spongiae]|uniref:Uncharacterized protein n=2 Tax=Pelagibaculum spongiae TaxID=2080658 RepID=A0A2V1GX59_9GAMM|nr:hypothetical protein DC094_01670 [Pelagibaculum spongiae]